MFTTTGTAKFIRPGQWAIDTGYWQPKTRFLFHVKLPAEVG